LSGSDGDTDEDEDVAELLRLAGPLSPVPEERLARLRTAAHREWRRTVNRRRWRPVSVALGLLAAAGLFWALDLPASLLRGRGARSPAGVVSHVSGDLRDLSPGASPGTRLGSGAGLWPGSVVATAKGKAAVDWHDGTRLRIDEDTRVQVEPDALVLESGGLYVETDAGRTPRSAFTVTTRLGSTSHLGTRYEVRMGAAGLRVRVREGAVRVERADEGETVSVGEELSVRNEGAVSRRRVSIHGPDWGWVTAAGPPFRMEGRSVRALLDWAAAEGGWALQFSDASVADLAASTRLHGTIEDMAPEDALAAVLPTCGLEHRLDEGRLVVRRLPRR